MLGFTIGEPNNFFNMPLSKNPQTSRHSKFNLLCRDVFGFFNRGLSKKLFGSPNFEHQPYSSVRYTSKTKPSGKTVNIQL